jgi:hypothetical protein
LKEANMIRAVGTIHAQDLARHSRIFEASKIQAA